MHDGGGRSPAEKFRLCNTLCLIVVFLAIGNRLSSRPPSSASGRSAPAGIDEPRAAT